MGELVIKNLSKSFGAVKALDKVNFSAKFGEVHAILGENGAGKSTLIKILSGFQSADEGTIQIDGKPLDVHSPKIAIENGVGTVYQELSLMHDLTVAQNLFFDNWPKTRKVGINPSTLEKQAKEVLEKYGIDDIDPSVSVGKLSLSQQQILEIIKVVIRNPQILILDEATSALTTNKVDWLLKFAMKQAKEEGKLVIFISHRLQEIKNSCNRITIFRNGQDVGVREIKNMNDDEIVSMMLGKKLSAFYPERINHSQNEIMLKVENYNLEKKLDNVSFEMKKGEVLGVGGLAGQGQNSLFLALGGVYNCSGKLTIDGQQKHIKTPKEGIDNGIVLIPEDRSREGLIQQLSIRDNISLPVLNKISYLSLINRKKENRNVQAAIKQLSIKLDTPNESVSNLSGGNQQKVLISKYLVRKPKVYLFLDPTRGVDVGTKAEIFKLVRKLAEEGAGVLYYSTDMEELINICDRVMVMYDKRIEETLCGDAITKENILRVSIGEKING